jgi:hypothetical protein
LYDACSNVVASNPVDVTQNVDHIFLRDVDINVSDDSQVALEGVKENGLLGPVPASHEHCVDRWCWNR